MPRNCSGCGVFDSSRRFHDAVPASAKPALRPTRGSGLGGSADLLLAAGDGAADWLEVVDCEHAAATSMSANGSERENTGAMVVSLGVTEWSYRRGAPRASAPSGRSRWTDRR